MLRPERVQKVADEVAAVFGIKSSWIFLGDRRRSSVQARAVVSCLLRDVFDMSSLEIGEALGRNHTTVLQHWQRVSSDNSLSAARDRCALRLRAWLSTERRPLSD